MQQTVGNLPENVRCHDGVKVWGERAEQVLNEKVTCPDFKHWLLRWFHDEEFHNTKLARSIKQLAETYQETQVSA